MSWRRPKPTGWATFDLKQKEKQTANTDLYPSLPSTTTVTLEVLPRNNHISAKPFSSVIQRSYPAHVNIKGNNSSTMGSSTSQVFTRVKALYSWADDGLIEDVLAATNGNFDQACLFLKAMVPQEKVEKIEDNKVVKPVKNDVMKKTSGTLNTCSDLDSGVSDNKLLDGIDINRIQDKLSDVPVEPEWEEDDVYLSHRKDAIKMMRAAARHSKAATNSYLRGDHFSAQQLSLKANEERIEAEKLNAKAAREILTARNENNGIWKLDLHGLHATEASTVLQERLQMIETQIFFKGPNRVNASNVRSKVRVSSDEGMVIAGQKPMWLEVITGIGNHSKGGAALPTAVKTFLSENGYRVDEARPGVIMVRPKVRHT